MAASEPPKPSSQGLADKVAIVTGASRGIGAGIALELARRGARVVITYTSSSSSNLVDELIQTIDTLTGSTNTAATAAIGIQADLRDPDSAQKIVQETLGAFQTAHIDILINNAGTEIVKPFTDISTADFAFVYDLHVRAPLLMLQAIQPCLRTRGARIVNVGSVGARCGFRNLSLYCSSKAALEGMTRCWAAELGGAGHTVNMVNPGPTETEMIENIPKDLVEMQKATTPVENRMGSVDDVAQIVVWLASEESRWVSGQVISASGGWAMY